MKINEIFYSIQGEGKWTGLPNVFIRTSGCNLRCTYCDTKYAYENGKEISIQKIVSEIKKYDCKNICITGGEPLLQKDILKLIDQLLSLKYNICIETNGSINIKDLLEKKHILISMDIKCPSSNMDEKMFFKNISMLRTEDQLKFIINDKKDYDYAKKVIVKYKPECFIFLQPVWGTNIKKLAHWIIKDKLNVRLGLQLQKIIWSEKKGV